MTSTVTHRPSAEAKLSQSPEDGGHPTDTFDGPGGVDRLVHAWQGQA